MARQKEPRLTYGKVLICYRSGNAHLGYDGTGGLGGILIVDTDDRKEAEAFAANDPFTKAGLFEKVTVTRWRKAYFDGRKLI